MNPLADIWSLFFPATCVACGCALGEGGDFLCNRCRWEIPLTEFWHKGDNPVWRKFAGHVPVQAASSFYFFADRSDFRTLIHDFKYHGAWRVAEKMGEWYGSELAASQTHENIDLLVPVPLHVRKKIGRGYNQSDYIARGMSRAMGVPVDRRAVRRAVHNRSQTQQKHKSERWDNVKDIFAVRDAAMLDGRHILVVDDVLTTGATIISLCETILAAVPTCRISIATLAVSKAELRTVRRTY